MKIGIVSSHSFPLPNPDPSTKSCSVPHTGDVVISGLARTLAEMGHEISMFSPEGSYVPPNGHLYPMRCSFGGYPPSGDQCEEECYSVHQKALSEQDIIHDFSNGKRISKIMSDNGKKVINTLMGGPWLKPYQPINLIAWSRSHRERIIKGHTDFVETPTPNLAGADGLPVNDAHVVNGGIDTDFYSPGTESKKDFYLFVGRWHEVRGYKVAIELAKKTGISLVMAGEKPSSEKFEYQKNCALEAIRLASNVPNIRFEWLPPDDPDHHIVKRDLFRQARALILPTQFREPFGLTLVEALACGTPVIATDYGSHPENLKDGVTGFVRKNDIDDLSSVISLVSTIDPTVCRADAVARFDRKIMAANYLEQYNKIMAGESW